MSVVKKATKKTRVPKAQPARYDYYVYPMGQLASQGIAALFEAFGDQASDDDMVRLDIGQEERLPVWSIKREAMWQIHQSPEYRCGEHYQLYRKDQKTGQVTAVPPAYFKRDQRSPTRKLTRAEIAREIWEILQNRCSGKRGAETKP